MEIRELVDRGDNVQRLGGKLAGTKRKRVRAYCLYSKANFGAKGRCGSL